MLGWILYQKDTLQDSYENTRFLEEAKLLQITLKVVHPPDFGWVLGGDFPLLYKGKAISLPDFVIPRLGAMTDTHTWNLLHFFHLKGVRLFNSLSLIRLAQNKLDCLFQLASLGIPVPKTTALHLVESTYSIQRVFDFPLVVKNNVGTHGKGIILCTSDQILEDLMPILLEQTNQNFIVQEYVDTRPGEDIRIVLTQNTVLGTMKRIAGRDQWKSNFTLGGKVEPYPWDDSLDSIASKIQKNLTFDLLGIDLLMTESGYVVNEINSAPGFKGMELALKNNMARLILEQCIEFVPG